MEGWKEIFLTGNISGGKHINTRDNDRTGSTITLFSTTMAPIEFTVYKASPSGEVKQGTTTKDDLSKDQVLVRITHSGVCYTDVHYRKSGIVLGHEGVGIVDRVGPEVSSVKACVDY